MDTSVVHCRLMLSAECVTVDIIKYGKNGHSSPSVVHCRLMLSAGRVTEDHIEYSKNGHSSPSAL